MLLVNKVNLGFGQANNQGIQWAIEKGASHVFLLNQDATIFPDTLRELLFGFESLRQTGIVSPVHFDGAGRDFDEYFFQYFLRSEIRNYLAGKLLKLNEPRQFIQTRFVNAAAWLVSTGCIKDIGLFDPLFFHYGEDRNFCHRAVYRGYQILIASNSMICHDRDSRVRSKNISASSRRQKELTNFLVDAANIRRNSINWFISKRIGRYVLLGFICGITLQLSKAHYNGKMAVGILKKWRPILNSRRRSFLGFRQKGTKGRQFEKE